FEARQHLTDPGHELVARPDERAVLVGGVGVVAVAHQLEVEAVDTPAVAQHDGPDLLLVEQPLDVEVTLHAHPLPRRRGPTPGPASAPARGPSGETRPRPRRPRSRGTGRVTPAAPPAPPGARP